MGAFLVFLPRPGAEPGEGFTRARAWIEQGIGLVADAETDDAVHFARRGVAEPPPSLERPDGFRVAAGVPHGDDAPDGTFAIAQREGGTLTVTPDHLGRLHVYAAETPGGVLVSTSSLALARAVGASPDAAGVAEFLMSGNVFAERTLFRGVTRLAGGFAHRFVDGRPAGCEPTLLLPPAGPLGRGDDVEAVLEACTQACRDAAATAQRPLSDLTGGLDSRLVLGLLLRAGAGFDVTVTGSDKNPDVAIARRLARRLGLRILVEPPSLGQDARRSFEEVLAAAALCDGECDAIEYAGIAAGHLRHAGEHDASINGSGGEVYRNYWWDARHLDGEHDSVALATPRFANLCLPVPFLPGAEAQAHFRAVLERSLEGRRGDPAPAQLDHAYLHLRMQSWQGAIASATNRIWPNHSPLMRRRPLEAMYRLDPRRRLDDALFHDLLARLGHGLAQVPLEGGFPPIKPGVANFWRFLPGLAAKPAELYRRLQDRRERRGHTGGAGAGQLTALFNAGAADYLRPAEMASAGLFDADALATFLETARTTGRAPTALVGRLLSVEFALRSARS